MRGGPARWIRPACGIGIPVLLSLLATLAQASVQCPSLEESNRRIQARADFLKGQPLGELQAGLAATAPDIFVALASVITARAKEEGRFWLIDEISHQLCKDASDGKAFFPNTCRTVETSANYPGPSITLLRTQFKKDVYALPACYYYRATQQPEGTSNSVPAKSDEAIDSYLIEATLLGLYRNSPAGKKLPPDDAADLPAFPGAVPDDAVLVELLVKAASASVKGWRIPAAGNGALATDCGAPQGPETWATFVSDVSKFVSKQPRPSEIAILREVAREIVAICPAAAGQAKRIEEFADVYSAAVRGNYSEAALVAADEFLCRPATSANKSLCSRLPVIGQVASAKTQADMEAALDLVIEPIGAWKRKESEPVWSIDSMVGFAAGAEWLKIDSMSRAHATTGLYLPIGVEWSTPTGFAKWPKSAAVGLTMLDLGALASYGQQVHVGGGQARTTSNTKFSSVTSPGIYVTMALSGPFRAGVSVSRTPGLRSVNFSGGTTRDADSTRAMLFLTADVTLLAF